MTSRLSLARSSLAPAVRQPLGPAIPQQQQQQASTGRNSAAFEKENAAPMPIKKTRLSMKAMVPPAAMPTAAPAVPAGSPTAAANGTVEVPGYSRAMITQHGKPEALSFEEVRAEAMAARERAQQKASQPSAKKQHQQQQQQPSLSFQLAGTPEASPLSTNHRQPSPTMCTRAALNDIDAMFKDASPRSSPLAVPFSARSLTTDLPSMDLALAGLHAANAQKGRPSPVAFTVFADEETRNLTVNSSSVAAQEHATASANFSAQSYPPLTPILEMSHESDMSHASNTSVVAPTPAARAAPVDEVAGGADDNTIDPFEAAQREQWITELDVLTQPGVTDLSSQALNLDFQSLSDGSETQVEIGDCLFQVTGVLGDTGADTGADRAVTLLATNIYEGGDVQLRLGSRHLALEHQFAASCMSRVLEAAPASARGDTDAQLKGLFYTTHQTFVYADHSVAVSNVSSRGNLRQLLQAYSAAGAQMDERLVAFYCYELLKLLQFLHTNHLLHNGLTLDAIWLRYDDTPGWSDVWNAAGDHGWSGKGVSLGDFRACIDRALFPPEAAFKCESASALAAGNPMVAFAQQSLGLATWCAHVDLLSLAELTYDLLFGLRVTASAPFAESCALDESGQVQLTRPLTSAFASTTFAPVFETLLNFRPTSLGEAQHQESLELIALLMQHFEMALAIETNGHPVSSQLKTLLMKQQMMQLSKK